jgi:alkanesulfonate monooxygenase SsuD/methylene tetrahydromethanopterin reductase-like flavin-dependent oxidoreductase (luciferase family)
MAAARDLSLSVWTDVRPEPGQSARRRYSELLEEVRMVDELPFRAFCTTEQHGVDDGYLPSQLTLIAGLGTVTSRVRFRTNALLLPLYSWRRVVEEAIVADLLSGGRVDLGVAVGNYAREFELFGADITKRGELMEAALPFIRMGLTEGVLPDGPGGSPVPVLPRPAQFRMPIYMGGLADRVIDRAVRLTDGVLPVDFMEPEKAFPEFWETKLRPALERHDRTLDDFRFIVCTHLWASEDPERDWEGFYRSARDYQLRKYAEWRSGSEAGLPELEALASPDSLLVDTPENLAKRLLALRTQIPFDELVFWYRIPGISHERALEHLGVVGRHVIPLLGDPPPDGTLEASGPA